MGDSRVYRGLLLRDVGQGADCRGREDDLREVRREDSDRKHLHQQMGCGRGVPPERVFPLFRGGDPEGLLQERRTLPGEGDSGRSDRGVREQRFRCFKENEENRS